MAVFNFNNIQIAGMSCVVPKNIVHPDDYKDRFGDEEVEKFKTMTGIQMSRQTSKFQTASDLCYTAADYLIKEDLQLVGDWRLTPYDWSTFTLIFDTIAGIKSGVPEPASLFELTRPDYKKKIILMDPRTSTPGLGFKVWAQKVYGDKYDDYMKRLEPSILTMSPSWSVGYGMFTEGEAPLVISYTTSAAYHIEYDEGDQFKALKFTDGHVRQIEGACVVKNAPNVEGAKKFLDFFITEEAQNVIPLTQWMFPANKNVKLPESYDVAF